MPRWWSAEPVGEPFRLGGRAHRVALAATLAAVVMSIGVGRHLGVRGRSVARRVIVAGLWGQEASYHAWRLRHGTWSLREMLPLHLCSVLVWAGGAALLRPRSGWDDVVWFWGMAGAPQALLTPDLGEYGPAHYRFHQFFVSHGLVLLVPLWMVAVEGHRPTVKGGVRAWLLLLAQAGVAHLVNRRVGSNYLFVSGRPETASLLDRLPPWPRYVPILAGVAAVVMGATLVPFALVDVLRARRLRRR